MKRIERIKTDENGWRMAYVKASNMKLVRRSMDLIQDDYVLRNKTKFLLTREELYKLIFFVEQFKRESIRFKPPIVSFLVGMIENNELLSLEFGVKYT